MVRWWDCDLPALQFKSQGTFFWETAFDLITYKLLKNWHDKAKLIRTLNYAFVVLLEMLWSN